MFDVAAMPYDECSVYAMTARARVSHCASVMSGSVTRVSVAATPGISMTERSTVARGNLAWRISSRAQGTALETSPQLFSIVMISARVSGLS